MNLADYKKTTPKELKKIFEKVVSESPKSRIKIAVEMGFNSEGTVRNCIAIDKVTDDTLSIFMKVIGVDALVVYHHGDKYFYLKN